MDRATEKVGVRNPSRSTVLLVEDDPNDVFRIQRAFRQAGLANPLQIVTDGEQAIEYLSGQTIYQERDRYPIPVLILLDLKLPRRSGIDVLGWLRKEPMIQYLPVVVLTSSEQQVDLKQAYAAGANSYLAKPPTTEALLEMVKSIGLYWILLNRSPEIEVN